MESVFKVAIIGAGGISGAHVNAAKSSGGRVQVSAVADPVEANRVKLAEQTGAKAFASAKELFASVKAGTVQVDGVVICTPPSARLDIVAQCFKHKLPILSEKPIAHTLADAKKLAALAKKNKKTPSFVAYCHRFTPAVLRMKELLAEGKLGRLTRFENAFACDLPGHEGKWFSDPKKAGGGAYLDMGSHSDDLLQFVVGPSKTLASVFDNKWKGRTETAATVLTKSTKKLGPNIPAGVAGVIISGWAETSRFTVALFGDKGMLFYDYEKPNELLFKDLVGKAESLPIQSHDVRFTHQLVAFANAVQNKAKTNLATFEDGVSAAALNDSATKLARKK